MSDLTFLVLVSDTLKEFDTLPGGILPRLPSTVAYRDAHRQFSAGASPRRVQDMIRRAILDLLPKEPANG